MAKLFEEIDDKLRAFIEAQPMFFVATAPSGDDGHVNVSPKGGENLFRVTGPLGFAYADMLGSGIETAAHLQENATDAASDAIENVQDDANVPDEAQEALEQAQQDLENVNP